MPYKGERASKGGHTDIVKNPDVASFLQECEYMKVPSEEEGKEIAELYKEIELGGSLPEKIVASDASTYSEPINNNFPSTQIGYVKVSLVLIEINNYNGLYLDNRFVDPFKVAQLHKNSDAIAFTLPGSNIQYKGESSVANGFRRAVYEQFCSQNTQFSKTGDYNIKGTLYYLDRIIDEPLLEVHKCPSCGYNEQTFSFDTNEVVNCPNCKENIYFTDSLRLHEQISDFGNSASAITRFMNVTEHLLMATLIRMMADNYPEALSKMAFMIDGPLAIFGQPARVHARLMKFYFDVRQKLHSMNLSTPIIVGLQKTGQLAEHAEAINRYIEPKTFKLIDDTYRSKYIVGFEKSSENFGHETYYGQDFIFKSASGKVFVIGIPYPFAKKNIKKEFAKQKANVDTYKDILSRTFKLIQHFEFELYENAVVPIALAHRHASISLVPGGKVLDMLSRSGLIK